MGMYNILILLVFLNLHYMYISEIPVENTTKLLLLIIYIVLFLLFGVVFSAFKIGIVRIIDIVYSQSLSMFLSGCILYLLVCIVSVGIYRPALCFSIMIIQFLVIVVWGYLGHHIYYKLNKAVKILLVYGNCPNILLNKMKKHASRFDIIEFLHSNNNIDEIKEKSKFHGAVMLYETNSEMKQVLLTYCFENNIKLFVVPTISDIVLHDAKQSHLIDTPFYVSDHFELSNEQCIMKRVLDLIIIIPIAIILSPFMLLIAIAIKLEDHGPIFYNQKRLTKNGEEFYVHKFRSMVVNAEEQGAQLSTKNDARITRIGKIIRKVRFDELPQILNILVGEMSMVGPRPERPEIAGDYSKEFPEFKYRLKVKAGLTGYAQIFGKYNTTPIDKVKMDIMYIQNYTLLLDIKLILMTIKILFVPESTEGIEEGKKNANDIPLY